jgi:hypothetical protein
MRRTIGVRRELRAIRQGEDVVGDLASARVLGDEDVRDRCRRAARFLDGREDERLLELLLAVVLAEGPEELGRPLERTRVDGRRIVLYRSGRRHAGENVGRLLAERPEGLPAPVQVGDALARNWSHVFTVVVAKCMAHARRQFVVRFGGHRLASSSKTRPV